MARYAARWIYMALMMWAHDQKGASNSGEDLARQKGRVGGGSRMGEARNRNRGKAEEIAVGGWGRRTAARCVGNIGGGRDASAALGAIGVGGGGCEDVVGGGRWRGRRKERWTATAIQGAQQRGTDCDDSGGERCGAESEGTAAVTGKGNGRQDGRHPIWRNRR
uniref:DUF834 domain-containing protein n=1 Tax=Oryza glumipatula TaxID=40148 RepID=A0A0E0AU00_9ORYZ